MKLKYIVLFGFLLLPASLARAAEGAEGGFSGKVLETTNTAGYTYVQVDTGSKKLWAVTTQFAVQVGDAVTVGAGAAMPEYHSQTLNRTFDVVYFTSRITVAGAAAGTVPALPPGHPPLPDAGAPTLPAGHPPVPAAANTEMRGIQRVAGGNTIAELYADKGELAGKPVSVRGRVVKYNAMILGKNWLHLRDGSGTAGNHDNDLTVTTDFAAKLGDIVVATGKLGTNRDFGAGYKYTVIIEDARVVQE